VSGNGAQNGGGGVGLFFIHNNGAPDSRIERSTISGNYATVGGGVGEDLIFTTGSSSLRIDASTLTGNYAFYAGGGLVTGRFVSKNTYVTNTTISRNAAEVGGGVFHYA